MLIKNQLSSILLTIALATTASFANHTTHHDALDIVAPATKTPSIITTSPHVLREIKSTLDQLKAGEAKFQETETYLIGELSRSLKAGHIHSSRAVSDKEFRVPALRRKF